VRRKTSQRAVESGVVMALPFGPQPVEYVWRNDLFAVQPTIYLPVGKSGFEFDPDGEWSITHIATGFAPWVHFEGPREAQAAAVELSELDGFRHMDGIIATDFKSAAYKELGPCVREIIGRHA
jgi:hypothetical protein